VLLARHSSSHTLLWWWTQHQYTYCLFDVDWAHDLDDQKSRSGCTIFLNQASSYLLDFTKIDMHSCFNHRKWICCSMLYSQISSLVMQISFWCWLSSRRAYFLILWQSICYMACAKLVISSTHKAYWSPISHASRIFTMQRRHSLLDFYSTSSVKYTNQGPTSW